MQNYIKYLKIKTCIEHSEMSVFLLGLNYTDTKLNYFNHCTKFVLKN